jgi:hypothetical protein
MSLTPIPPDRRVVALEAGAAPELSLSYSFSFSAYQRVMRLVREPLALAAEEDAHVLADAVARIKAIYYPIGPFNFLEMGAADAETVERFQEQLRVQAELLSDGLGAALRSTEASYRARFWPEHGAALSEALDSVAALLSPQKDVLLTRLAEGFGVRSQPGAYRVHLVPICHESTGGYSHPTVVSVAAFKGLHLVEAILHELTHVMLHHQQADQGTVFGALKALCERQERPVRVAYELLHVLVFHAAGELVREHYGRDHVPHARRRGIYRKAGAMLRANLSEEVIAEIWVGPRQHAGGPAEVAERLMAAVAEGAGRSPAAA